jgi:hypothetical protein
MTDPLYEKLKALYGEEFARKYLAKRRSAMATLTPEELEEVKAFADEHMPESDNFAVKWNGYDVLLVETPSRDDLREPKPTSGANWRALVTWAGSPYDSDFVTVFAPEAEAKKLAKKGLFYLVGKLKEKQYNGKPSLVFNAVAVIEVATVEGPEVRELPDEEVEEFFEVEEIVAGRGD